MKNRDSAAHFVFENLSFSTKNRDSAAHFVFENRRFSTKNRDSAAHFVFENRSFSTKNCDFGAHVGLQNDAFFVVIAGALVAYCWRSGSSGGCAPRFARGSVAGPPGSKRPATLLVAGSVGKQERSVYAPETL